MAVGRRCESQAAYGSTGLGTAPGMIGGGIWVGTVTIAQVVGKQVFEREERERKERIDTFLRLLGINRERRPHDPTMPQV